MTTRATVAEVRRALGPVGAFVGMTDSPPAVGGQLDGVRRLEGAGYRALWTNEVIGADALVRASLWLAATEQVMVGTCIANMWARPALTAHAAATQLSQAYPGRFVLGLGVGYAQQAASVGREFGSAVATARAYLQQLRDPGYPRILAANGPLMLRLAGELTDGALPAGAPATATSAARASLGADKLLVVYAPVQLSDTTPSVAANISAHLDAGADHVIVGMSSSTDFSVAVDRMMHLSATLTAHRG